MTGFVYVITNNYMPGVVKIGLTNETPRQRLKNLDNTSVPEAFELEYAVKVDDPKQIEKLMHEVFAQKRIRQNREFFEMSKESAIAALKLTGAMEVDLDGGEIKDGKQKLESIAVDETGQEVHTKKPRRSPFSFTELNIQPGEELEFTRNSEKKCKVFDDRRVEFQGEIYSVSSLANKFITEGGSGSSNVAGTLYFRYKGQVLADLRREIEQDIE